MSVTRTSAGGIILNLPYHLGFSMIWDSFKCALRSARRCGPGSIRANRIKVARDSAQLMISLTGRETALPMLKSIARHVALEVSR